MIKHARLVLKCILPIFGSLILLNGAYIGIKGMQEKDLDFVVTGKTWSTHKHGSISYYLKLCPIDNNYTCTSITEHESVWNEYSIGDPITIKMALMRVQTGIESFYGFMCFATIVSLLIVFGGQYIWSLLVLLYKD